MKTRLYMILCLPLLLASCNQWLDVELDNRVDEEKLYSTAEGFRESLAGVYGSMADTTLYGSFLTIQYTDLLGQYYDYNGVNAKYEYFKNFDYENSGVRSTIDAIWLNMYKCVAQLNNILEWTDKNRKVLSDAERDQIRGEAIALRAFLHFDLYRMFCPDAKRSPKAQGIPYNKQFGVSTPPMYTVEEIVQLVINDLKEAEVLLARDPITTTVPYTLDNDSADKCVARMNLWAVKAMLARACQARGEYTKAVDAAKEVIASGKFRLMVESDIDRAETEVDATFSAEHIFSLRNKRLADISRWLHRSYTVNGVTSLTPLPFYNYTAIYEKNNDDARLAKWFNLGDFMKYQYNNSAIFYRKMPVIKLSEMYLLIAECSYDTDPAQSLEYVNALRNSRIRGNVPLQFISKATIVAEMRREYLGEGQMWYVFKRNNLTIPGNSPTGEIAPSDDVFVFPMPQDEIEDGHRDVE